jgi:hypothetical protein
MLDRTQFRPFGNVMMVIGVLFIAGTAAMILYALDHPAEPGQFGLPHVLYTLAGLVGPIGAGMIALGVWARQKSN